MSLITSKYSVQITTRYISPITTISPNTMIFENVACKGLYCECRGPNLRQAQTTNEQMLGWCMDV